MRQHLFFPIPQHPLTSQPAQQTSSVPLSSEWCSSRGVCNITALWAMKYRLWVFYSDILWLRSSHQAALVKKKLKIAFEPWTPSGHKIAPCLMRGGLAEDCQLNLLRSFYRLRKSTWSWWKKVHSVKWDRRRVV